MTNRICKLSVPEYDAHPDRIGRRMFDPAEVARVASSMQSERTGEEATK